MPAPLLTRYEPIISVLMLAYTPLQVFGSIAGIFTGFFAYYLHETHPRTNLAPGHRLTDLVEWKWAKYKREREEQLRALE